jgi:hypothetical protein
MPDCRKATNRLAEAEPLMRRHVQIFVRFGQITGHPHPHMEVALMNYIGLLTRMELAEDEISRRLQALFATPATFEPITPEIDRLLGPAKPTGEALHELDEQYRASGKYVQAYFLPLAERLAPHLDAVLGPAAPFAEALDVIDQRYRREGKYVEAYFLPLSEPFAPQLDEILRPPDANES